MVGALVPAFGASHFATLLRHLSAGTLFVVIDALDEAQSRVGEASIFDFLEDIGKTAQSAPGAAFVLLGRTRIAEDCWLVLTELGVRTSLYTIDFFDKAQRIKYLDQRLERNPETAASIAGHRAEFEEARNLLFSQLDIAIDPAGGNEDTREAAAFLGYAPVLDAIAVLLESKQNYHALANQLREEEQKAGATSGSGRMDLLKMVVERILEREQERMLQNLVRELAGQAPAGWRDWKQLYTPAEQRARLLARILGDPWAPPVPIPAAMRQRYEDQIRSFFDEHAFLREAKSAASIVFEAYLFADALVDPIHPLRDKLAIYIEGRQALPSRLLADFYFYFTAAANRAIPLTHVGILYGSVLSGETESRRVRLEVNAGDPEPDEWDKTVPNVEFEWVDPTAGEAENAELAWMPTEGKLANKTTVLTRSHPSSMG